MTPFYTECQPVSVPGPLRTSKYLHIYGRLRLGKSISLKMTIFCYQLETAVLLMISGMCEVLQVGVTEPMSSHTPTSYKPGSNVTCRLCLSTIERLSYNQTFTESLPSATL